ncbi:phosphate ABC transporter substrate-binding/OmpA family protein [bacterium]|nr:phosphate ABC transporter substrate-binding/OmpA family protein [bacterium]
MIPKYFRCGEPSGNCPLFVSKEIFKEKDDCSCPGCSCSDEFLEPVSLVDGLTNGKARLVYVVSAIIAVLAVGLLAFSSSDKIADELGQLQSRLDSLEGEVSNIVSTSSTSSKNAPPVNIADFTTKVKELESIGRNGLENGDEKSISLIRGSIKKELANIGNAVETIEQPEAGIGVDGARVKRVIPKIETLSEEGEVILEEANNSSSNLVGEIDEFLSDAKSLQAKAYGLLRSSSESPVSPELLALKNELQDLASQLRQLDQKLAAFEPKLPPPFLDEEADLRIAASNDLSRSLIAPLIEAWSGTNGYVDEKGRYFFETNGKGKVLLSSLSSDSGFEKLAAKNIDLLFVDRPPTQAELAKVGSGYSASRSVAEVIALDALTLSVHPDSKTDTYELEGASRAEIVSSSAAPASKNKAVDFSLKIARELEGTSEQIALKDSSVIVLGQYHTEGVNLRAKRLSVRASNDSLPLKPSPFTIATEDYRFSYRVVGWTAKNAAEKALTFLSFSTSNEGQAVVSEQGFVDLRLKPMPGNALPEILAALGDALGVDKITSAVRLSTNLRFSTGKYDLDLKALADLERLPRFLAERYPTEKVVILGYTDSDGGPAVNKPLSKDRANEVAKVLRESSIDTRAGGLGSSFPVDSNNTESGKAKNRRAEVWVVKP